MALLPKLVTNADIGRNEKEAGAHEPLRHSSSNGNHCRRACNDPAYVFVLHPMVQQQAILRICAHDESAGRILDLLEAARPAGDMSDPALPDLILCQDMLGGSRLSGNLGGGRFDVTSEKGDFFLAAPNFANTSCVDTSYQVRSLSFPMAQWQKCSMKPPTARFSLEGLRLYRGSFNSPAIQSALRNLWALCDEEGAPSRLLARAAGCEILAELCRLGGAPFAPVKGGLAPWAQRRLWSLFGRGFPKTSASTNWQPRRSSHHFISHACSSRASACRHGST